MNDEKKLLMLIIVITSITLVICARFAQKAMEAQQAIDETFATINNVLGIK